MIEQSRIFGGMEIITNQWMTKSIVRRRSWRERLLSWPWRPWKAITVEIVGDDQVLRHGNQLFMHPQTLEKLKRQLRAAAPQSEEDRTK